MSTYKVAICRASQYPNVGGLLCELVAGHAGDHRAVDIAQVGNQIVRWPATPGPAPQFEPGDRVTLEGTVTGDKPPNTLAQFVPVRLIGTQSGFPVMVLARFLTLIESGQCAALFPGRENEDPPPRCVKHADHTELHESAEGWRWGTIEQRTDDAHAPAEPRCQHSRGSLLPGIGTQRCWGMAGHIGPHRTPLGEWT